MSVRQRGGSDSHGLDSVGSRFPSIRSTEMSNPHRLVVESGWRGRMTPSDAVDVLECGHTVASQERDWYSLPCPECGREKREAEPPVSGPPPGGEVGK